MRGEKKAQTFLFLFFSWLLSGRTALGGKRARGARSKSKKKEREGLYTTTPKSVAGNNLRNSSSRVFCCRAFDNLLGGDECKDAHTQVRT